MAQVVIFAPPGEDVSSGEQALKDAGHEVEVVEATAENLLHMAIGMISDNESENTTKEQPPAEKEPPAEKDAPAEEAKETPEQNPQKMESLSSCLIDDERVMAKRGKKTRLFVSELQRGEKTTFTLNESVISIWSKEYDLLMVTSKGNKIGAKVPVLQSKFGRTYLEVGPDLIDMF